jgi:endonuclease YncB( thermonuclease family)
MMAWLWRWVRRVPALLLLAGLLALLAYLRTPEQFSDADGARVYVMDGDSLRIGPRIIRLAGIDAVELHQLCEGADKAQWSCGLEAREALRDLVARGDLACASSGGDRYGRAIAQCSAQGSRNLAADLAALGWAVSGDGRGDGRYLAEQAEAKAAARGIWRGTFQRPAEWRAAHPRDGD